MKVELLKALADSCKRCFQDMTGTKVESVKVKKDQRLSEHYALALAVNFTDQAKRHDGRFVMGFADEHMAEVFAASLADNFGQPAPQGLGDEAVDLLGEFMNTVVGHTITRWEDSGFSASFSHPKVIQGASLATYDGIMTESYVVILDLAFGWMVFSVSFVDRTQMIAGNKALVVDDSNVVRGIITRALEQVGLKVVTGSDGKQAVDLHGKHKPDITIMDMVMPNLGGLEAIMEIRKKNTDARFIILSSSAKKEEVAAAETLGVFRYLVKPVKVDELISAIREALNPQ